MDATSGNMVTTVSKGSSSNCPSEYNQRHAGKTRLRICSIGYSCSTKAEREGENERE